MGAGFLAAWGSFAGVTGFVQEQEVVAEPAMFVITSAVPRGNRCAGKGSPAAFPCEIWGARILGT